MGSAISPGTIFRFGWFEADGARHTLTRKGVRVRIQDQPFRVLILLLENPGELVTREELYKRLWPEGTYVDFDGSLNVILKRLRAALEDDPQNPRFIETVPRRGYRFIAPVQAGDERAETTPASSVEPEQHGGALAATFPRRYPNESTRRFHWGRGWIAVTLVSLLLIALASFRSNKQRSGADDVAAEIAPAKSIAVIPFSNSGAGPALDYLRFALASNIVTDLTYARSISVRPFASTARYGEHPADPETVGRELKVSYVISGDLAGEPGELEISAELTRVADDRVIWRDRVSASPNDLVHLYEDVTQRLKGGVIEALGSGQMAGEIPMPHSQKAYSLYLNALAIPHDPEPNKVAIADLTESVGDDPSYAPAWDQLAWRLYVDAAYAGGGEEAYKKSEEARERAAALDPNGTSDWATIRADHGDLKGAYVLARGVVLRRPDFWGGYFEMSYVFRYAGLLDQAAKECDTALAIDENYGIRSCAKVFMYRGDYKRAELFVDLDGSSGWNVRQRMQFALRQGRDADALALATVAVEAGYVDSEIIQARLQNESPKTLNAVATKVEDLATRASDPEEKYETAAMLSYAGQADGAMRLLKAAIERNYCATPQLESDPLLAPLRGRAEFQQLKAAAAACQRNFQSHTGALALSIPSQSH